MQHAYRSPGRTAPQPAKNPLEGVLGLDRGGVVVWVAAALAILLHLLLPIFVRGLAFVMVFVGALFARLLPAPPVKVMSDPIEVELAPPPEPPPAKEEPKEEPKPEPPKEIPKDMKAPEAPKDAPVAAAAQAAAVMTSETKPDEPVDLTNSFVTGSGTSYAGGTTMAAGTGTAAVRAPTAAVTGTPGGTGNGPPAQVGPDRSRNAGLGGSKSWNDCPFPPEADVDNIDQAAVLVQVTVSPDGRPGAVKIVSDPGHGFGRAARACAMQRSYQTALDREGKPVGGVFTANVTFAR